MDPSERRRDRRPWRAAILAGLVLALSTLATEARAQLPGASDGITLQEALDATLLHSPQLQLGERQVESGAGALLAARASFDAQLVTSLEAEREISVSPNALGSMSQLRTNTLMYSVALPKRLRSGMTITPRVGLTRVEIANAPRALTNRASVNLDVLVPLLRDRGGAVTSAPERAARRNYDASVLDARHAAAAAILGAAMAYWDELAVEERLDVYRSSESRAQRLVDDTRKLVEADERPAAELKQLLANLALKRAARISGEQASVEARQQLALVIGVYDAGDAALPRATSSFPEILPDTAPSSRTSTSAITEAFRQRADLAALAARRLAAEVQLGAARAESRPRLDVAVRLGYEGVAAEPGANGALSSFYRNVPGLNASVQLGYDLSFSKLAARGDALRSSAAYAQARIREADLVRRISSSVFVARAALRHSRQALLASREAVALSRQAIENEQRKFQLGMSTLFDVILAGDALTNARLAEIAGQHDYAAAIARLRYETGAILGTDGVRLSVSAALMGREP